MPNASEHQPLGKRKGYCHVCRYCDQHKETAEHLVYECVQRHGSTHYKQRHDLVCKIIYDGILEAYGAKVDSKWWKLQPELRANLGVAVCYTEKRSGTLAMQTLSPPFIKYRRTDLVPIIRDEILITEIGCLNKEIWKNESYSELLDQLTIAHNKPTQVVPIPVGHTGAIKKRLRKHTEALGITTQIAKLRKTTAVGAVRILYNLLRRKQRGGL